MDIAAVFLNKDKSGPSHQCKLLHLGWCDNRLHYSKAGEGGAAFKDQHHAFNRDIRLSH